MFILGFVITRFYSMGNWFSLNIVNFSYTVQLERQSSWTEQKSKSNIEDFTPIPLNLFFKESKILCIIWLKIIVINLSASQYVWPLVVLNFVLECYCPVTFLIGWMWKMFVLKGFDISCLSYKDSKYKQKNMLHQLLLLLLNTHWTRKVYMFFTSPDISYDTKIEIFVTKSR